MVTSVTSGCARDDFHLFCFGADHDTPVTAEPKTGRRAFISVDNLAPGAGIAGADALCDAEAAAQGWTTGGTYKAPLATESESALSRMDVQGIAWVRVDGLPLVAEAADLGSGELLVPLMQQADGTYIHASIGVWAGADGLSSTGVGTSCSSWTTDVGTGIWTFNTTAGEFFNSTYSQPCASEKPVFCFEQ
jgi:hypothetical protein